jgi:carboxylesterase
MRDYGIFEAGGSTGYLLLHGLGGTPVQFRYVARELSKAGFTILAPQLAGHCGTSEEFRRSTWQQWYASAEAALEALSARCERVIVCGHSMGALLSLHLAAQNPVQIDRLALIAPAFDLDGWGVPLKQKLFRLVTQKWCADLFDFSERDTFGLKDERVRALVMRARANENYNAEFGQRYFYGGVFLEWSWLAKTVKRELGAIGHDTLIIHPRDDDRANYSKNAVTLQLRMPGLIETMTLNDSYHGVIVDRQRDIVAKRLITWGQDARRSAVTEPAAQRPTRNAARGVA